METRTDEMQMVSRAVESACTSVVIIIPTAEKGRRAEVVFLAGYIRTSCAPARRVRATGAERGTASQDGDIVQASVPRTGER